MKLEFLKNPLCPKFNVGEFIRCGMYSIMVAEIKACRDCPTVVGRLEAISTGSPSSIDSCEGCYAKYAYKSRISGTFYCSQRYAWRRDGKLIIDVESDNYDEEEEDNYDDEEDYEEEDE